MEIDEFTEVKLTFDWVSFFEMYNELVNNR